jgi:50S ribosomal protein L16 3-hydroxylase
MSKKFLAGLTREEFLRRHWQKKALLARNALPGYAGAIGRDELFELATRPDFESRIVTRSRERWRVRHGPFTRRELQRMPRRGSTLLVQGTELALSQAARLLRTFTFIPYARLDDVMVSYATPGGGVGPHFDSYDVFLVQTFGRRHWRIGAQRNLELEPDTPLKILKDFRPEAEWSVSPGDVLYLPPRYAHDGVALDECITCSVGFRAPAAQELAARFLDFVQDRLDLDGLYSDPGLTRARHPAQIPASMLSYAARTLERLRWSRGDVVEFMGRYLSEPKNNIVFERSRRRAPLAEFERQAAQHGLRLAPPTRMLFHRRKLFINGEAVNANTAAAPALMRLADERELNAPVDLPADTWSLLHEWYLAGYVQLQPAHRE